MSDIITSTFSNLDLDLYDTDLDVTTIRSTSRVYPLCTEFFCGKGFMIDRRSFRAWCLPEAYRLLVPCLFTNLQNFKFHIPMSFRIRHGLRHKTDEGLLKVRQAF